MSYLKAEKTEDMTDITRLRQFIFGLATGAGFPRDTTKTAAVIRLMESNAAAMRASGIEPVADQLKAITVRGGGLPSSTRMEQFISAAGFCLDVLRNRQADNSPHKEAIKEMLRRGERRGDMQDDDGSSMMLAIPSPRG